MSETNGHIAPQQIRLGRPPTAYAEPIRTALLRSARTIKEISTNWQAAVAIDSKGIFHVTNKDAADLCAAQIRLLAKKLHALTGEVEERIS